jgi:hypothetical protein
MSFTDAPEKESVFNQEDKKDRKETYVYPRLAITVG